MKEESTFMQVLREAGTLPKIPSHYLKQLSSKGNSNKVYLLVRLVERQYDITDQERELLNSIVDDFEHYR